MMLKVALFFLLHMNRRPIWDPTRVPLFLHYICNIKFKNTFLIMFYLNFYVLCMNRDNILSLKIKNYFFNTLNLYVCMCVYVRARDFTMTLNAIY